MNRIVDFHTHVFPDDLAPKAIPALEAQGGITACYDGTVRGLLGAMDVAGVTASVILPVATKATQVGPANDFAAAAARANAGRIIAFGAMHPDVEDPASEMARMRSLGIQGFKMHPEYQSFEPHEPRMERIYQAAQAEGLIALFHAGGDVAWETRRGTCEAFCEVLDAWPHLTVVLAHMGGFRQWDDAAALLAGRDVWLDTAYTLGHLPDEEFVSLARAHGTDRILWGSDGPWTDAGAEIAHLSKLGFTQTELDGILGANASRLLGLAE